MRKLLFKVTLSHQPVGWDPRDVPRPRVVLTDVDLDLKASASSDAALAVVETLVPMERPLTALRLDLESSVYTTFGRNLTKRSERLRRVTDEAGRTLALVHDYDEALVQ